MINLYRYCKHCDVEPKTDECYWNHVTEQCPMYPDYKDAAEFESRVAAKLAINDTSYLPCHQKGHENQCPYNNLYPNDKQRTAWCKLKHARLQVEEEMNANN